MQIVPNEGAGQVALCSRCGVRCRVAEARNEDARLLKHAGEASPDALCVSCAATAFLKTTEPCGMLIAQAGPECLQMEHIREQFAAIMRVGESDAAPPEVDWERVIEHWDLPFPARPRRRRA